MDGTMSALIPTCLISLLKSDNRIVVLTEVRGKNYIIKEMGIAW